MKTITITHLKSIFRSMAIITVLTVIVAIVPSCKGKSNPSDAPGPPPPPPPLPYNISNGDTIWFRVDELPVFSEDSLALMDFLSVNLVYPEAAKKKKVQGRVVVGFVLTADCRVTDARIVTGIDRDCDNEALRVVNSLPKFEKPAYVDGKPVAYHFTFPVHYVLQ